MDKILFLVRITGGNVENVLVVARDREDAKRQAQHVLGRNPDQYIVEPLYSNFNRGQTVILL